MSDIIIFSILGVLVLVLLGLARLLERSEDLYRTLDMLEKMNEKVGGEKRRGKK